VSARGRAWTLVNATPDVRLQIESFPALHPGPGRRETPLRNILLTDAELDHTLGLLVLREGAALDVYGTAAVFGALADAFPVRRLLEPYATIRWREVKTQEDFPLEDGQLRLKAFHLGNKRPRFVPGTKTESKAGSEDGVDWVVGYRLEDVETRGVVVYAPGVERWTSELGQELAGADCVFLDGTFWTDREMIEVGVGRLTAEAMGHLPISGPGGSAELLSALALERKVYVHINNTNPVLDDESPERHALAERGVEVGWDGMELEV
jgi:pyrroloquinoline quinone biosynthesis protein B